MMGLGEKRRVRRGYGVNMSKKDLGKKKPHSAAHVRSTVKPPRTERKRSRKREGTGTSGEDD